MFKDVPVFFSAARAIILLCYIDQLSLCKTVAFHASSDQHLTTRKSVGGEDLEQQLFFQLHMVSDVVLGRDLNFYFGSDLQEPLEVGLSGQRYPQITSLHARGGS